MTDDSTKTLSTSYPRFRSLDHGPPAAPTSPSIPQPPSAACMAGLDGGELDPTLNFGRFPILEICPDAPDFFAEAATSPPVTSVRSSTLMRLDVDPRDPASDLSRRSSERCEKAALGRCRSSKCGRPRNVAPATRPDSGRDQNGNARDVQASAHEAAPRQIHEDLHYRLSRTLVAPVAADVAVAAFCEYAIAYYYATL